MLDLRPLSGLPLALDDSGLLVLGPGVMVDEHKERLLDALTPVALDPEACRGSREVAYYMDNGVYHQDDADRLADLPLRYELTLIPPRRLGREFVKTFGHVHHPEPRSGMAWAEVCEVLVGTAHFLLHTLDLEGPGASKAFYVEATVGQKIVIPPDLDHLTINPGPEPLLFSDVIALGVTGDYDRYRATRGGAYLEVAESGQPRFIPNPSYREVAPLRKIELGDYPELGLAGDEPLYTAFVRTRGEKWPFLPDPSRFWATFPGLAEAIGV
jgi:glucose-6-phosphate isomerase